MASFLPLLYGSSYVAGVSAYQMERACVGFQKGVTGSGLYILGCHKELFSMALYWEFRLYGHTVYQSFAI